MTPNNPKRVLAEQLDLGEFLTTKEGKTMLKGHLLRRALPITIQRLNERLADEPIELHELGRSGIKKPLGSIALGTSDHDTLYVTHYRTENGEKHRVLEQLAKKLSKKFDLQLDHKHREY